MWLENALTPTPLGANKASRNMNIRLIRALLFVPTVCSLNYSYVVYDSATGGLNKTIQSWSYGQINLQAVAPAGLPSHPKYAISVGADWSTGLALQSFVRSPSGPLVLVRILLGSRPTYLRLRAHKSQRSASLREANIHFWNFGFADLLKILKCRAC